MVERLPGEGPPARLLALGAEDAVWLVEDRFGRLTGRVGLEVHAKAGQALHVEGQFLARNQFVARLAGHGEAQGIADDGQRNGLVSEPVISGEPFENLG